ncbi:hypothetical protein Tco_0641025 [Tanacetum coccineum]
MRTIRRSRAKSVLIAGRHVSGVAIRKIVGLAPVECVDLKVRVQVVAGTYMLANDGWERHEEAAATYPDLWENNRNSERKSLLKKLLKVKESLKKEDTELQSKVEQVTETYRQSSTNLTNLTTMLREENVPSVMTNLEAIQNTLNSKNAHHTTLAESYKYLVWNMGPRLTNIEETQSFIHILPQSILKLQK